MHKCLERVLYDPTLDPLEALADALLPLILAEQGTYQRIGVCPVALCCCVVPYCHAHITPWHAHITPWHACIATFITLLPTGPAMSGNVSTQQPICIAKHTQITSPIAPPPTLSPTGTLLLASQQDPALRGILEQALHKLLVLGPGGVAVDRQAKRKFRSNLIAFAGQARSVVCVR